MGFLYVIERKIVEAQVCPLCRGSGRCQPANTYANTDVPVVRDCHACNGKGIVWPPGFFDYQPCGDRVNAVGR